MSKRVLFLWSATSGYMAACWRALAISASLKVTVVADLNGNQTSFHESMLKGVRWVRRERAFADRVRQVRQIIRTEQPDAIVLGGWHDRGYMAAVAETGATKWARILTCDNPWNGTLRQHLALFMRGAISRAFDVIVVPGERGAQYALRLGFSWDRIAMPLYGVDWEKFAILAEGEGGERRGFLFVGRYVQEKGLGTLLKAYSRYRQAVANPWPLVTCGMGPLGGLVAETPGVEDRGFVQPEDLPHELARAGAFVLPSWIDHWGVAIVEACAAGLPIIATRTCGATVECVRDGWNGILVAPRDPHSLCEALVSMHRNPHRLEMGRRSTELARPFSSEQWARSWLGIIERAIRYRLKRTASTGQARSFAASASSLDAP